MDGEEEIWEKLDAEFDHCVVDMKPYVLKLQHRSERQRCALWIKKLCEPSGAGTGIVGRKNRNLYAKLLLHMLKRGVLEGPFTHKPEAGILKTLPSYMSIYFDEPNSTRVRSSSPDCLPDWVMGELGNGESKHEESWKVSSKEESSSATPLTYGERFKYSEKPASRSHSMSPPHRMGEDNLATPLSDHHHKKTISLDDSDLEARLNSWNLGLENPRYLREKPMPVSLMTPKIGLGKSTTFRDEHAVFRMHEKEFWKSVGKVLDAGAGVLFSLLCTEAARQKRFSCLQSAGGVVGGVRLEGGVVLGKAMGEFSRGYRIPAG